MDIDCVCPPVPRLSRSCCAGSAVSRLFHNVKVQEERYYCRYTTKHPRTVSAQSSGSQRRVKPGDLVSAWGPVVALTTYKALRPGKLVMTVSPGYSSQDCAQRTFTSPGQSADSSQVFLSTLRTHRLDRPPCGVGNHAAGNPNASMRRSADPISQTNTDFSETRAGTVRRDDWGRSAQRSISQESFGATPKPPPRHSQAVGEFTYCTYNEKGGGGL